MMITTTPLSATLDRMHSLNRALDRAFSSGWDSSTERVWIPALDVVERKDAYVVLAELPGVAPKDVDISFEQNVLTVRGTKAASTETTGNADLRVYASERVTGSFERSIRLPEFVDGEHISATAANGVLEITIPKAQVAQPRKIEIRTDAAAA